MKLAHAVSVAVITVVTHAAAAPSGSVEGTVIFEGEPPEAAALRVTDPACGAVAADDVVVARGKLKDVLVRVKGKLPPPPKGALPPVVIDQRGCRYTPRVVGILPGQQLQVRNSDGTFHNVHGTVGGKLAWNRPAPQGSAPLVLDGARAGEVIDLTCDVHPWMRAYAVVHDSAAFAVTDEAGHFAIGNLPPGRYTLEAWHPVLGTRSLDIQIGSGGKAGVTARLSYKRGE